MDTRHTKTYMYGVHGFVLGLQDSLLKKMKAYHKRMKNNSKNGVRWEASVGMEVIGRNSKRLKSETNRVKGNPGKSTAATFKFPGHIIEFAGADSCSVKWGEKGGPGKENAGEVSVVRNYLNNLRPRRALGGDEFVTFNRSGADKKREGVKKNDKQPIDDEVS